MSGINCHNFFPNDKGFSMHLQFGRILEQNVVIKVINQQQ